jgi:hypothetical protein
MWLLGWLIHLLLRDVLHLLVPERGLQVHRDGEARTAVLM